MSRITVIAYAAEHYDLNRLISNVVCEKTDEETRIRVIVTDSVPDMERSESITRNAGDFFDIEYIGCPGKNIAECYNAAVKFIVSNDYDDDEYIAFADCDTTYSKNCLANIFRIIRDEKISVKPYICINPCFVRSNGKKQNYPAV